MGLVLAIDEGQVFAQTVAQLLGDFGGEVRHATAYTDGEGEACVLVFGPSVASAVAFEAARACQRAGGRQAVIMVVDELTTDVMREAMRSGVSDVLDSSGQASELSRAVIDLYRKVEELRLAEKPQQPVAAIIPTGKVITVMSTKGGVGKTVLAVNLAVTLARSGNRTCLVDLDLQFGDVAIMLGLPPERTISDLMGSIDRLDEPLLAGYLTEHQSGIKALLAPVRPEDAETVTTGRLARVLDMLRGMFDYVVIDTSASLDETLLTALDRSDQICAMTMMDVASVKNMRISLQKMQQLGYDGHLVKLILNRADSKVFLQPSEVEKAVGRPIFAKIPSDRLVPRSVNKGVPVVVDEPRSDVAKALVSLTETIAKSERGEADVA